MNTPHLTNHPHKNEVTNVVNAETTIGIKMFLIKHWKRYCNACTYSIGDEGNKFNIGGIMKTNRKVRNFSREIIRMAEERELTEEEFTSAIDTARKIIRRNPITSKCLEGIKLEVNNPFDEIDIVETSPEP